MKVDFTLSAEPGDGDLAAAAELRRYDGIWLPEITHDPFPLLAVAASRTETIELGTAIAVAFARNPMSMALVANDLQLYSGGRFLLGVGARRSSHVSPSGSRCRGPRRPTGCGNMCSRCARSTAGPPGSC